MAAKRSARSIKRVGSETKTTNGSSRTLLKVFAVIALLVISVNSVWAFEYWPYPYKFEVLQAIPSANVGHVSMFTIDLGPENDPLTARISPERSPLNKYRTAVYYTDRSGGVVTQKNFLWHAWELGGVDLDGDGSNELLASYAGDTLAGIVAFESPPNADTLWHYTLLERDFRWRQRTDRWDVYFERGQVIELSDPKRRAIVFSCQSGFCQLPRGLILLDAATGQEIWRLWFASNTEQSVVVSPTLGKQLLVVGTSSSANGAKWDDTTDDKCYLYAVDIATGARIWTREFPGPFSFVCVDQVKDPVTQAVELVAMFGSSAEAGERARLMRVSPESGETISELGLPEGLKSGDMRIWRGQQGHWRAHVVRIGGGLFAYDESWKLIQSRDGVESILAMGNWEGDETPEFVVRNTGGELLYLDESLKLASLHHFQGYLVTEQTFRDSRWPEIWATDGKEERRLTIRENDQYVMQVTNRVLVPMLTVALFAWLSVVTIRLRRAIVAERRKQVRMKEWAMSASALAHDINIPIKVLDTAIENYSRRLAKSHPDVDTAGLVSKIRRETDRFRNTVRQLRVLGKIDEPELQIMFPSMILNDVVNRLRSIHRGEMILDVDPHTPLIRIDVRLFESMLENLVGNAIQATENSNGAILISTRVKSDELVVEVRDYGCGISPEKLDRLFVPYDSSKSGGTGLGMFRVKEIVNIHKGRIEVQSEMGKGTSVCVYFPIQDRNIE